MTRQDLDLIYISSVFLIQIIFVSRRDLDLYDKYIVFPI
jgi:hypothetical protein